MKAKYPVRKVVAVDVDGTLHHNGVPRLDVIARLRELQAAGYELFLLSARGEVYATKVAVDLGVRELFVHVLTKPGFIVDDEGWSWIKFTRRVTITRAPTKLGSF